MTEKAFTAEEMKIVYKILGGSQDTENKIADSKAKLLEYLLFEKNTGKTPTEQFCGGEDAIKLTIFELYSLYLRQEKYDEMNKLDPLDD
jgi:hypothetical protein